jgi:hypothetical protein
VLLLHEIPLSIKDTCYPLPSHEGWIKFRGAGHKYRLQPIEINVANAAATGADAVRALNGNILFLWLGKIFYGILYRELSLLLDRSTSNGITIATPTMLRKYEAHLLLLQEARQKVTLEDFTPGSIYVFKCQVPRQPNLQWDFCDNVDTMFIGMRMAEVGIVGVLGDGGAQLIYQDSYRELMDLPLHPIQFRELCAHFSYRSTLGTRTPKLIIGQGKPHKVFQLPLGGFSMKPYFEEWIEEDYARFFAFYTGCPFDRAFSPPDRVMTWLHDPNGNVRYLDYGKHPFGPTDPT